MILFLLQTRTGSVSTLSNSFHIDDLAGQRLRNSVSSGEESTHPAQRPSQFCQVALNLLLGRLVRKWNGLANTASLQMAFRNRVLVLGEVKTACSSFRPSTCVAASAFGSDKATM